MKEQLPIDFEAGREARDTGMKRVRRKADADVPNWTRLATDYIRLFCTQRAAPFFAEELVAASKAHGLIQPENPKAWGPAMKVACKAGIIEFVGYGNSPSRHLSPARKWQSKICRWAP